MEEAAEENDKVRVGFAKRLASCNKKTCDTVVELLRRWLEAQTHVSDLDFKKIWKGPFYCVWHADKHEVQAHLIDKLASLIRTLDLALARHYFQRFGSVWCLASGISNSFSFSWFMAFSTAGKTHGSIQRLQGQEIGHISAQLGLFSADRGSLPQNPGSAGSNQPDLTCARVLKWDGSDPTRNKTTQVVRSVLQIFVKMPKGSTIVIWTHDSDRVSDLKTKIADQTGYPAEVYHLLNEGRSMQEDSAMQEYKIKPGSTIILNMRLRGGAASAGTSSQSKGSFKEALKGKGKNHIAVPEPPGQYIVDQMPESPSISIEIPEVNDIYSDLQKNAVICRFNGFWPKTDALYQWIHSIWTKNCQIYLYPKGIFIVNFDTEKEKETILNQGPWFWGSAGLFITPWFPEVDANTMVVSRMPVWVRMHNLPLHFWHSKALIAIGNTLGRMLKIDRERYIKGIFTFARICVEVDLSRGLPESIILNFNNTQWKQSLDYENTTFRCRGCQQTGHLYNACPRIIKSKQQPKKSKGWQNTDVVYKKTASEKKEEQKTTKDKEQENKDKEMNEEKEQELQLEINGCKRSHNPEGSDSDKEQPMNSEGNQLAIIDSTPTMDGWRKVEKKKGRKT